MTATDGTDIPEEVLHLVRAVADVDDPVMTCEECQEWLPSYVDAEIGGLDVGQLYPEVKRHLDLCGDCINEYLEMLDWGVAEDEAGWQMAAAPTAPDLSFLPPLPITTSTPTVSYSEYIRSLAQSIVQSLAPQRIREFKTMADMFLKRLKVVGEDYAFKPTPVLSSGPNSGQYIVATHMTNQRLREEWSIEEIETQIRHRTLEQSVREVAEEEARKQGFRKEDAQRFAEKYTEEMCQDPDVFRSFLSD